MLNTLLAVAVLALAEPGAGAGDIPDTQAFVTWTGPGYSVLVPEGWSRSRRGSAVTFTWNANAETIVANVPADPNGVLRAQFGATGPITVRKTTIAGQTATVFNFTSRAKADPVTGKSLRLEDQAFLFERRGRRVLVVLSAPAGADNVDQWKKISESFRWR